MYLITSIENFIFIPYKYFKNVLFNYYKYHYLTIVLTQQGPNRTFKEKKYIKTKLNFVGTKT